MSTQTNIVRAPRAWKWFVAYCAFLAIIYLLFIALGIAVLLGDPATFDVEPIEATGYAVFLVAIGLLLFIPFATAPFLPKRPWVWTFDIVLIGFGMTSIITLPAAIPLLIFWLKPDTRVFFGKAPS